MSFAILRISQIDALFECLGPDLLLPQQYGRLLLGSDRCKLFEVGFLRGFLGFLAGERAHGGFPRRIPLDSYGGFSLSAGIPTEERARRALATSSVRGCAWK